MTSDDPPPLARVWFVDVGAGDCTLVLDTATRRALLIDCPSSKVGEVRRILAAEGASLDTVVVTHWDIDHYGGASRLAIAMKVNKVLYNHDTLFASDESPGQLIRTTLKNFLNIPFGQDILGPASVGQEGAIGKISWRILAPTHAELTTAYVSRKRNVASAVVEVELPSFRILIGGDAVGATWRRLLSGNIGKADVLRWPHHGADLAGDLRGDIRDGVLAAVDPGLVIISTGSTNPHGHPSKDVVSHAVINSSVSCTEVTAGCFGFTSRESRKSDEAQILMHDHRNEPCAGTVLIDCWESSHRVSPSPAERAARIASWPYPMCLKHMASLSQ